MDVSGPRATDAREMKRAFPQYARAGSWAAVFAFRCGRVPPSRAAVAVPRTSGTLPDLTPRRLRLLQCPSWRSTGIHSQLVRAGTTALVTIIVIARFAVAIQPDSDGVSATSAAGAPGTSLRLSAVAALGGVARSRE